MMHIYKYIFICFTLCVVFFCVVCVMFSVSIDVIHI